MSAVVVLERIVAVVVLFNLTIAGGLIGYALNSKTCAERRRRRYRRLNRHNPSTCRACAMAAHPSRSSLDALENLWTASR